MEQPFVSIYASNWIVFSAQNLDHILNAIGITLIAISNIANIFGLLNDFFRAIQGEHKSLGKMGEWIIIIA